MIKTIVFDLWGTLIYNKSKDKYDKLNDYIVDKLGKSYKDNIYKQNIDEEQILHDMKVLSSSQDAKHLKKLLDDNINNFDIYIDAIETLEKLSNKYNLVLVSNTFYQTQFAIDSLDLNKYFKKVILSYKTGLIKPEISALDNILTECECEANEVLFIGDSYRNDFESQIVYGFKAVLLDRNDRHEQISPRIRHLNEIFKEIENINKEYLI